MTGPKSAPAENDTLEAEAETAFQSSIDIFGIEPRLSGDARIRTAWREAWNPGGVSGKTRAAWRAKVAARGDGTQSASCWLQQPENAAYRHSYARRAAFNRLASPKEEGPTRFRGKS